MQVFERTSKVLTLKSKEQFNRFVEFILACFFGFIWASLLGGPFVALGFMLITLETTLGYLGGSLLIISSLIVFFWIYFKVLTAQTLISCTLDKKYGKMYLKYQNALKTEIRQKKLDEIIQVKMIEDSDGFDSFFTELRLKSGEKITLNSFSPTKDNEELVQTINEFLGLTS